MALMNYDDFYIRHERRNGFIGTLSRVLARDERTVVHKAHPSGGHVLAGHSVITTAIRSQTTDGERHFLSNDALDLYDNVYLMRKPFKVVSEHVAAYLTSEISR